MSITITKKDVGRRVKLRDGSFNAIERWVNDSNYPCCGNSSIGLCASWTETGAYWCTGPASNFDIIAFADEPAAPSLTEERIREIVREMMQPQPEKKEPVSGECWVNFYENGVAESASSRQEADQSASCANSKRIACVKAEFIEGEGL